MGTVQTHKGAKKAKMLRDQQSRRARSLAKAVKTSHVDPTREPREPVRSTAPRSKSAKDHRAINRALMRDQGLNRLYERYQLARNAYERQEFLDSLHPTLRIKLERRSRLGN